MLVEVKESKFLRDTNSMALMNRDSGAKEEYYSKVRLAKMQKEEINTIKAEISSMKTDITEIKNLLGQLLSKGTNG